MAQRFHVLLNPITEGSRRPDAIDISTKGGGIFNVRITSEILCTDRASILNLRNKLTDILNSSEDDTILV